MLQTGLIEAVAKIRNIAAVTVLLSVLYQVIATIITG